ncbi:MAG TPA: hypothetical protein VME22_23785 [Solirubrobacteraceae bacterium]|nr:hypothetical protein [Solirubrobacteraceae bacterium]
MIGAVRAELATIRQTRSVVLVLAGAIAIAGLAPLTASAKALTDLLHTEIIILTLFVLMASVIVTAGEYQHRTVGWTLIGTPRRGRVVIAKLLAVGAMGGVTAAAALVATGGVARADHGALPVGTDVDALIAGQLALGILTACFGAAWAWPCETFREGSRSC